jgi:hypothetical protein
MHGAIPPLPSTLHGTVFRHLTDRIRAITAIITRNVKSNNKVSPFSGVQYEIHPIYETINAPCLNMAWGGGGELLANTDYLKTGYVLALYYVAGSAAISSGSFFTTEILAKQLVMAKET